MADEWLQFCNDQIEAKKQQHPKPSIPAIPAIPEPIEDLYRFNTGASSDHDNGEFDGYSKSQNHKQSSAAPVYDQEEPVSDSAANAIPITKKPIQPKRAVEPVHVEVTPSAPKKRPIEATTTKTATAPVAAPSKIISAAKEAEKTTVVPKPAPQKSQAPKTAGVVAPAPGIQKKIAPAVTQEVFDDDGDETEDVGDPMEVIEQPKKIMEKKQPVATPVTTQPPKPQQYGMVPAPAQKPLVAPSKAPVAPAKPVIQQPRPQTPAVSKTASAVATQPKPPAVQAKPPAEAAKYKQLAAINRKIERDEDDDEDEEEEEEEEEEEKPIQPASKRAKMTVDDYAVHEHHVKNIFRTVLTGMLMSLDATDEHTLAAAQQISSKLKSTMEANKMQANPQSKQRSKPKPMERKITEIEGPMMSLYAYDEDQVALAVELMQNKVNEIIGKHVAADVVKNTEKKLTGFFPNRGHIGNPKLSELARGRYKTLCEFVSRMYLDDVKGYTQATKGISRADIVAKYCKENPLKNDSTWVSFVFVDEYENYIDYFANGIAHVIANIHVKQEALELKQREAMMNAQQEEQEEEEEEEERQDHQ